MRMIQKQGNWMPYELKPRERRFLTCEQLIQRQYRKGFLHRIVIIDSFELLREKRPEYEQRHDKVILLHDNARPHIAKIVKNIWKRSNSTATADNLNSNDDHGFSDDVSMSHVQENSENEHRGNFPKDTYKNQELSTWLCSWKLKHNISHDAISELLNQLRMCGHADLPKDARTLGTLMFNPVEISASGGITYTLSGDHSPKIIQSLSGADVALQNRTFGIFSHVQFRKNISRDMNAHQNTFWYCNYTDKVGPILCNEIDRSNLIILNKDAPTLMQPPNLILASPNLALIPDSQTDSDPQGSNHFPVCTTIGGNMNTHPTFWYCDYTNKAGQILCSEIDRSNLVILNKDAPTLMQPPDLVLASPNLALIADSQTDSNPQSSSDHFPVCTTIEGKVTHSRQFHYSDKYYDGNIQPRNLDDKSEQVVADKSKQVMANKSEQRMTDKSEQMVTDKSKQVVADKSEQVVADKSKQMVTDKSEQVVADKSEQMVIDKSEQVMTDESEHVMTDESEQMVADNYSHDEDAQSSAWTDKIRLREHLIAEIRKRPPLWNFKLPLAKRRIHRRERLWEEVSIKLNREGSTKKLKKMWRSLCDSFRVHHYRKKMLPSKSTICNPWVHYESMKFISDVQLQSFTITNPSDIKATDRTVNDDNNSTDRCARNRATKNPERRCTKRNYT
ncbi:hypothetical protein ALC53_03271 [Atta colombica]|uniref:MADF domain-containing protein n=1 Tax=Atta colombica TaxID=520822 RepID=A0A195BQ83_9HYME|nr:hypothetical protein ALC53_03271 [Atta colombica]